WRETNQRVYSAACIADRDSGGVPLLALYRIPIAGVGPFFVGTAACANRTTRSHFRVMLTACGRLSPVIPIVRVTFICSSLEPGRDGVGDYSRRLAYALERQGHAAQLVGLNDRHLSVDEDGVDHTTVRLAASTKWATRIDKARC